MTRECVDDLFRSYRFDVGRCGYLETEINRLTKEISRMMDSLAEDASAIRPQQISDMPHGSGVGNPTERIALMLASGWVSDEIKAMQNELAVLQREHDVRSLGTRYVESWLSGLTVRERWILTHQVIDGEYWKEVIAKFKDDFGEDISKDSLKRLKQRALGKVYTMAE